ncbi:uncharacterized protein LOC129942497 isoform X2 [Eupeodes corollae]|uniref:uncharacterized protein LOC129942497 isoform X2 n=1 Tax=Eupeodes corollae TaxID=290404 RepID=UPI00248F6355|nr:uncharacterized protein LOC129942497 isoform X2 [Eupeodes corollae]
MARQPRRSALVLTRKSRSRTIYSHSSPQLCTQSRFLPLVALALTILIEISRAQSNLDLNANANAPVIVTQPKFGDRLLPRNRQIANSFNTTNVNRSELNVASSNNHNHFGPVYIRAGSEVEKEIRTISDNGSDKNLNRIIFQNNNSSISSVTASATATVKENHPHPQPQRRRNDNDNDIEEVASVVSAAALDSLSDNNEVAPSRDYLNVSKAARLIEMSTEFFIVPTSTTTEKPAVPSTTSKFRSVDSTGQHKNNHLQPRPVLILAPKNPSHGNTSAAAVTPPTIVSTRLPNGLRKEPWVVPVLVLASLTMIMMGAFEIFVLFKAWRTSPSRRHLFLGQMLLLGLFACAGLGAIITAQPTVLSCGAIRFGAGVAYALVFAALLVKCVFLISLNGGVYLPAPYQGLLLLFAVLIQVAIGAQWLLNQPPDIYTMTVPFGVSGSATSAGTSGNSNMGSSSVSNKLSSMLITSSDITRLQHGSTATMMIPLCKTQFSELLLSLIYIVFLIVFVAVLAIKSRGIRDNYRESTYIGLAIGGAIPIWLGWMLCGLAVADRHKDACIAFGLVATSATVFLVMFMPKGRQLAAMGKEGLYVEDREEQFSSLSRAGSGYSPSFFHFKPIKYGVMGPVPNSTSNTGNGNSTKHTATMNGGDHVALVAAAPPSYTRMYHYFPAHVTHPFCFYPQPPPPPQINPPLPPTLKALGSSVASMTPAHLAQTLRYPGKAYLYDPMRSTYIPHWSPH